MKIITQGTDLGVQGSVVSIGMFDGVHRGHRKVLGLLRERGRALGLQTVVVTFDPHPRAVVRPEGSPMLLSSLSDRLRLLASTGAVDHCLVLHFDRARSMQPADEFVLTDLVLGLRMRELVVGENFACGRQRQGTVAHLAAVGMQLGFAVTPVLLDAVPGSPDAVRSSSSEARRLIQLGDVTGASTVLDRPHEMTSIVTRTARGPHWSLEAELPESLCAPAPAHYVGAVQRGGLAAPWHPALLEVRATAASQRRTVQLVTGRDVQAMPGDPLRLRFIDRAHAPSLPYLSSSLTPSWPTSALAAH
jgi:riboflavin kinase/FMN adenylyltransferase